MAALRFNRKNRPGDKRMLMLFTGIAIGFLLSTAVFASMARVNTH